MDCLKPSRLSGFDPNIESNNALLTLTDLESLDEDGFFQGGILDMKATSPTQFSKPVIQVNKSNCKMMLCRLWKAGRETDMKVFSLSHVNKSVLRINRSNHRIMMFCGLGEINKKLSEM